MQIGRRLEAILLSPLALSMVVAVVIPGIILFGYSLFVWQFLEPVGELTLANYANLVTDPLYAKLLQNTLAIAVPTTMLSVAGGFILAYRIVFGTGRGGNLMFGLMVTALMASYLVRIFAWRTLLGENGIVNTLLAAVGLIDEPVQFLLFSRASVILAEVALFMPLAALAIYAALSGIPGDLREAARDLGASRAQTLRRVTIPLIGPTLLATTALTFFLASGDYVTPVLVGGVDSSTFGTIIASRIGPAADYGTGATVSIAVLVGFVIVYGMLRRLMRAASLLPERTA